jgi:hypothetical protein
MHIIVVKRTRRVEALQIFVRKHSVVRISFNEPRTAPFYSKRAISKCTRTDFHFAQKQKDSPLRSLLVQHTVTAILAADLIASLQGDARIAFAAQIGDDRPIHRASGHTLGAKGILGAE